LFKAHAYDNYPANGFCGDDYIGKISMETRPRSGSLTDMRENFPQLFAEDDHTEGELKRIEVNST
jgi:hypothetical protein